MIEAVLSGLALGLGGSLHCVGMCGPIVSAFSLSTRQQTWSQTLRTTLSYNFGRISTYLLLGALFGWLGSFSDSLMVLKVLRVAAAVLLLLAGLAIIFQLRMFSHLDFLGRGLWQRIRPLTQRLNPARSLVQAYLSGLLWGLLPCGLVYAAIAIALGQGSIHASMALMLGFALGTFFPMVMMGVGFSQLNKWLKTRLARILIGALMVLLALVALWPMFGNQHAQHSHSNAPASEQSKHDHSHH
ncbi:MAG: sulfite exporter TauE/SafE family protein [Gammaproteobacteria bacterium]|nr:sulfite exporter TauE/SafE family protein [Gammaproteobacteria bacterium]NVK87118.1 sulfite exporter TauE/SafE family protein [Gammaproteobacteria bacterium]